MPRPSNDRLPALQGHGAPAVARRPLLGTVLAFALASPGCLLALDEVHYRPLPADASVPDAPALDGAPADVPRTDAPPGRDGTVDVMGTDVPTGMPDAASDATIDAPADAPPDAPLDAPPDAPLDVPVDVPPDELIGLDAEPMDAMMDAPSRDGSVSDGVTPRDAIEPTDATMDASGDAAPCTSERDVCGGRCVDLQTDPQHCGACNAVCAPGTMCAAGVCGPLFDPPWTITGATIYSPPRSVLTADVPMGSTRIVVADGTQFGAWDEILVVSMRGTTAGTYGFHQVHTVASNTLEITPPLGALYRGAVTQVVKVRRVQSLELTAGSQLRITPWNGSTGGIAVIRVQGTAVISGLLDATGAGYRGGAGFPGGGTANYCGGGDQGESTPGPGTMSPMPNGGGGGGGGAGCNCCGIGGVVNSCGSSPGGGGGGFTAGSGSGGPANGSAGCVSGQGGEQYGGPLLARIFLGSGGGGGAGNCALASGAGGNGGGLLWLDADAIDLRASGAIRASGSSGAVGGASGQKWEGGGGGGSGGTIRLSVRDFRSAGGMIHAVGAGGGLQCNGNNYGAGGVGAPGRILVQCAMYNGVACSSATMLGAQPGATVVSR